MCSTHTHTHTHNTCFEEKSEEICAHKNNNKYKRISRDKELSTPVPQSPSLETTSVTSFWCVFAKNLHR